MNTTRSRAVAAALTFVLFALGMLATSGCDDDGPTGVQPAPLIGTWEGTDDELTIHLRTGQFQWLESTNNAPISFTFAYATALDTLKLTFEIMGSVSTTQYVPVH